MMCGHIPCSNDGDGRPVTTWHRLSECSVQDLNCVLSLQGGSGDASGAKCLLSQNHRSRAFSLAKVVMQRLDLGCQSSATESQRFTRHDQIHGDIQIVPRDSEPTRGKGTVLGYKQSQLGERHIAWNKE
eukprot:6368743-Amphidinium_carterae.2